MAKLQPAPIKLYFELTNAGSDAINVDTIDLAQCASAINRRFYRQGLNWAVAGFKFNVAGAGVLNVAKIPTTWVASNAWHKAFAAWKRQQDEALAEFDGDSAVARYRDFKIFIDEYHQEKGSASNLIPKSYYVTPDTGAVGTVAFTKGEWDMSRIVIPNLIADSSGSLVDPYEYELFMVGANTSTAAGASGKFARGIIEGYADSRAYPQSPDPVSPALDSDDNWLRNMFDVGNDSGEIVDLAIDQNDELPYAQVAYPGGDSNGKGLEIHSTHSVTTTTVGGSTSVEGGVFPCGLIRIVNQPTGTWTAAPTLIVTLVPGSHRGYLAEPMQDM